MADLAEVGLTLPAWRQKLQSGRNLYVDLPAARIDLLRASYPQLVAQTISAANQVLAHRFDLLGSGPYLPVDPERTETGSYVPIDWYLDPVSGLRFPRGIPVKEWDLYQMRPGQADIKLPWELARCQHFATLGQAWRLTNHNRYAREILYQLDDFMEANPVGLGINWTCTMDIALRALNWALGLTLVRHCKALPEACWTRAHESLFDHGVFIFENLEDKYEVTSNHFLSNVVGLYYLAEVFRDLPSGRRWEAFCRESLEREIEVQVLDDGADFESSLPYHRLVTESFLGGARLAQASGRPLSDSYLQRLHKMVDFLTGVLRPDGLMPLIGDADDGRLHIFTDYGRWQPQDARHLLTPAALLLGEPSWLNLGGPEGLWEAAWWGFKIPENTAPGELLPTFSKLFPEAGLAVARENGTYLLVTNGIVGTQGFGNHKHNDQLGFEYHREGLPLLVDPGSYVYTSDFEARNLFRSTRYHNTLSVDGKEQNKTNPEWIFRLFETAHAEHQAFEMTEDFVEYRGSHVGYRRLPDPVTHHRALRLLRPSGALLILDRLEGAGEHELLWHFHCAPGVRWKALPSRPSSWKTKRDATCCSIQGTFSSGSRKRGTLHPMECASGVLPSTWA